MGRRPTRAPRGRSVSGTPHGYRPLPGSERPQVPGSQFLEDVKPAEHIGFAIRMRRGREHPRSPGWITGRIRRRTGGISSQRKSTCADMALRKKMLKLLPVFSSRTTLM